MAILSSDKFVDELRERLGLPDGTTKFTLAAAVNEIVTVDCTYYPHPLRIQPKLEVLPAFKWCSDAFRRDMNKWLLDRFGATGEIESRRSLFKLVEIDD